MKEEDFEIFCDPCYFHMWALQNKNSKTWETTLHFNKKEEALHALQTIIGWSTLK